MEKNRRRSLILTLALTLALCFIAAFTFLLFPASAPTVYAGANEEADAAMWSAIKGVEASISNGAQVHTSQAYTIKFTTEINNDNMQTVYDAVDDAADERLDDFFICPYKKYCASFAILMFFDQSKIPALSQTLSGVTFGYDDYDTYYHAVRPNVLTISGEHIAVAGKKYYPAKKQYISTSEEYSTTMQGTVYSFNAGKEGKDTVWVPVLVIGGGYVTGPINDFGNDDKVNINAKLIYNPNAVRSVSGVSQAAYEDAYWEYEDLDEEEIDVVQKTLLTNMGTPQKFEELTTNDSIDNLIQTNPLNLHATAGAELDGNGNIRWSCTVNAANFNVWKSEMMSVEIRWLVREYKEGMSQDSFSENLLKAIQVYTDNNPTIDGENYVSTFSFAPVGRETIYIAIPYVRAVGLKPSSSDGVYIEYQGDENGPGGTYVVCEQNDNARSVNMLLEDDGEYTYNFVYLEELEDTPFAIKKTKTITSTERINMDKITSKELADIIEQEDKINSKGQIECLMSYINNWYIDQATADNYNIYAMYSFIPLTIVNESNGTDAILLSLIPFANIDGTNEYSKLITSLKDKEGKPYFERIDDVAVGDLYGYFYTYSYESESKDPNWQVDNEQYNGSIVYFTELERTEYKVGYVEIGTYGTIAGAVGGAIIGAIVGGPKGAVIGAFVGGAAVGVLSATTASLFGCEQDSETIYHHVEYGFLDCTNMLPSNYYDTEEEPELEIWENIALIAVAIFELYLILSINAKFKMPLIARLIVIAALIGLCVWGDIALYQFFLN